MHNKRTEKRISRRVFPPKTDFFNPKQSNNSMLNHDSIDNDYRIPKLKDREYL
jgi:hypothetical protein